MAEVATGRHLAGVLACGRGKACGEAQRREAVLFAQRVDVREHALLECRQGGSPVLWRRAGGRSDDPQADDGDRKRNEPDPATPHVWEIGASGPAATSLERATALRVTALLVCGAASRGTRPAAPRRPGSRPARRARRRARPRSTRRPTR